MKITIEITHQTGTLLTLALEKQIAKSARERDEFEDEGSRNLARCASEDVKWLKAVHDQVWETMYPTDPELVDFHEPGPEPSDLIEDASGWAQYSREHPDSDTDESRAEDSAMIEAAERKAGWDPTP